MTGDDSKSETTRDGSNGVRPPASIAPAFRPFVDPLPPGRALDVATGIGRNAHALTERGWTVDAIDLSRAQLDRARERASARSDTGTVNWILADADSYCFPRAVYDLVTVSFFDARDRLPALIAALAPGGLLCYEHYLESRADESGPGDRYRFGPNELLTACSALTILYYAEHRIGDEPRVTLVARAEDETSRWRPTVSSGTDLALEQE